MTAQRISRSAFESEAQLVARNVATIERVQQTLRDLRKKWASIDVHMKALTVTSSCRSIIAGRLMSLSLAPGLRRATQMRDLSR